MVAAEYDDFIDNIILGMSAFRLGSGRSRAVATYDCSSYHAGAWALRRISGELLLAGVRIRRVCLRHRRRRQAKPRRQLPAVEVEAPGRRRHAVSQTTEPRRQSQGTKRRGDPTSPSASRRRYVRFRNVRAPAAARHAASEKTVSGEEFNARPPSPARRNARGGAGADRHPAFRRRQSQPVFSARLQSRPRHRPRHHGRRHAGQHAARMATARAMPTSIS